MKDYYYKNLLDDEQYRIKKENEHFGPALLGTNKGFNDYNGPTIPIAPGVWKTID